jgi:hypothetical protein
LKGEEEEGLKGEEEEGVKGEEEEDQNSVDEEASTDDDEQQTEDCHVCQEPRRFSKIWVVKCPTCFWHEGYFSDLNGLAMWSVTFVQTYFLRI